jgi:hypothetical protein
MEHSRYVWIVAACLLAIPLVNGEQAALDQEARLRSEVWRGTMASKNADGHRCIKGELQPGYRKP